MREVHLPLRLVAITCLTISSVLSTANSIAQTSGMPATQTIQSPLRRLAAQPSPSEPKVALAGSVTDRPTTSTSLGHLPPDTHISAMSLIIKPSPAQQAALTQLLRDQQDPQSPSYHRWLTPQTFGDRFGMAPADLDILTAWLRAQGFEVAEVSESRNRIVFSGSAAQVETAFSVTLERFRRDGQTFFENRQPIRLPQSLTAVIGGVTGLSSYRLHSHAVRRDLPSFQPQYTSSTGLIALVPWDFRQLFDINPLIGSGSDGSGVKIGVIGQSAFSSTQISDFQLKTGQQSKLPNVVLVPNTGSSNLVEGDEDESEIDLEYSSGTAPGASVQFVYTGCTTSASSTALPNTTDCQNDGVNTALIYAITNDIAPILTFSYGACEAKIASYASSTLEPMLEQANAQGQTILVSSGDSGAATCDQGADARAATQGLSVSYPASSAYVTAVGGTQLSANGFASTNNSYGGSAISYFSEQAWNDTSSLGTLSASGGGVSKIFSKPAWQVGTSVPQDGFRDVPDVAFPASVSTVPYFACTANASCQADTTIGGTSTTSDGGLYGGTSLSAPNFAAMLAVIEQKNASGPLGNINPALYALAEGASANSVFHDVSGQDNKVPCVLGSPDCGESNTFRQIGYGAGAGYDQATGLGSISATGLAAALVASSAAVSLAVSPEQPIVGQPVTFTATLNTVSHTAPTGTVTFAIGGTAAGPAVPLTNGAASFKYSGFSSPGTASANQFAITASYSGDSTYSASTATLNLMAAQVPVSLSITSSNTSPPINMATTFTIAATGPYGTPTGYVLLFADNLYLANSASPLVLVNGVATFTYAGFSTTGVHQITAQYWSEFDNQNGQVQNAGYVPPYTAYEGGHAELDLPVTASTQTLTSSLTVTNTTTGPLAPNDSVSFSLVFKGNGSVAPTGLYTLSVDGVSGFEKLGATADGITYSLDIGGGNWTPGTHTVQVAYNGDNNYTPSAPTSASFIVVLPAFTLSASPTAITIPSGGSGSTTLTVNGDPTYSGSTTFHLALLSYTGAPFSGCYALSSSDVESQRGTPTSVTLTMYSGTSHCTSSNHIVAVSAATVPTPRNRLPLSIASLCLTGCLVFRRRRIASSLMMALLSATLISAIGCGGSSQTVTGGGGGNGGTTTPPAPAGTYVIQVTGISGADSTLAAKATFNLNIQGM